VASVGGAELLELSHRYRYFVAISFDKANLQVSMRVQPLGEAPGAALRDRDRRRRPPGASTVFREELTRDAGGQGFWRLSLLTDRAVDVESGSDGRFGADPDTAFARWTSYVSAETARTVTLRPTRTSSWVPPVLARRRCSPSAELTRPRRRVRCGDASTPAVFTKFASCLTGPYETVRLPATGSTGRSSWWWWSGATPRESPRRTPGRTSLG